MSKIEVRHLAKRFKFSKQPLLSEVNFTLDENEIYGLFGENGAGKSTLMSMISDYNRPSAGEVLYDGENVHENDVALSEIYYMNQDNMYPKKDKVRQIFSFVESMYEDYDVELQEKLVKEFKLDANQKLNKLSTGYQSIVKIIISLCVPCKFVLLDEPTLGLDARNREVFQRNLIETYSENPRTFVISTHIIDEIDRIISDVILLQDGVIKMNENLEDIASKSYSISGPAEDVDAYLQGIRVLEEEKLGRYKTVHFMDQLPQREVPASVDIEQMKLQKLLVYIMDRGEK
ncbi:ATP-binding cassette domain-containing protein [Apilactobacillus nanyangensis]|uniref:ABC transporter ATP-binding protein n=1 Tax=Apilactobacillus nanyangensis TaxID=2799579 RepID=A0ABT0HWP0_9LACO|nr:ABC transporter ATP-binding protein [Apilactobacillus nanyangensis]MCK8611342.1 ABC transporter ATP-binding protein [Apilactobacillus nanyangensis]